MSEVRRWSWLAAEQWADNPDPSTRRASPAAAGHANALPSVLPARAHGRLCLRRRRCAGAANPSRFHGFFMRGRRQARLLPCVGGLRPSRRAERNRRPPLRPRFGQAELAGGGTRQHARPQAPRVHHAKPSKVGWRRRRPTTPAKQSPTRWRDWSAISPAAPAREGRVSRLAETRLLVSAGPAAAGPS